MNAHLKIKRTGIEIIEVSSDMTLPDLAKHLNDLGLQPYQSKSHGSIINGRPIHRGEARPGQVHMYLYPYYLIGDPHNLYEARHRGGCFTFFGLGGEIVRNETIPAGTLVIVEPALQVKVTEQKKE